MGSKGESGLPKTSLPVAGVSSGVSAGVSPVPGSLVPPDWGPVVLLMSGGPRGLKLPSPKSSGST